jgi:hypothetical protein
MTIFTTRSLLEGKPHLPRSKANLTTFLRSTVYDGSVLPIFRITGDWWLNAYVLACRSTDRYLFMISMFRFTCGAATHKPSCSPHNLPGKPPPRKRRLLVFGTRSQVCTVRHEHGNSLRIPIGVISTTSSCWCFLVLLSGPDEP